MSAEVNLDPASQLGKTVINLSKTHFGPSEYDLLEKGLNFIPTPKYITKTPILEAATKFARRLKLAYHFRNSSYRVQQKFIPTSTWSPKDENMPKEILETIEKINSDLSDLTIPYHRNNLNVAEIAALKNIRKTPDIIIKPADKGSATVILDKQNYINEGYRQLGDNRYYEKIQNPIFLETGLKVNEILLDLLSKKFISEKQFEYLKSPEEPRPRQFYMLPKIHKPLDKWPVVNMPPGRPIISDCSSESYRVSEYIDHFLQPLASKHDSYLKDTSDFLNKLKQVKINENSLIVTMDVESMYTNIDHESGLAAVKNAFENNPDPLRPDQHILDLLELSLKKNDFQFNGETFLQIKGTAMGKKYAPSYANIFMAHFETQALKKCYLKPSVFFRFLDDIFCVWDHGRENLGTFLEIFNSHHPAVKLTANIQEFSNDFLDVTIFKGPLLKEKGIFDTKVYFKPTDTHQLLHKASFHPRHTFKGILKSQILRFYRICSQNSDFDSACSLVFKALSSRGYSKRSLRYIKSQTVNSIKSGHLISPPGMTAEPNLEYFAKSCENPHCHTCESVIECSAVKSNTTKFVFKIRENLTCSSSNIIYLVQCKECDKQYIGQTKRSLRLRTNNHRADIVNKRKSTIANHFNKGRCSIEDFQITPIFQCPTYQEEEQTTKTRLQIEQYFIETFKSYLPYGMNIAVKKFKDQQSIHFSVPFSILGKSAAKIIRDHYKDLQVILPEAFPQEFVAGYSRSKNLKDMLVSTKIRVNS